MICGTGKFSCCFRDISQYKPLSCFTGVSCGMFALWKGWVLENSTRKIFCHGFCWNAGETNARVTVTTFSALGIINTK